VRQAMTVMILQPQMYDLGRNSNCSYEDVSSLVPHRLSQTSYLSSSSLLPSVEGMYTLFPSSRMIDTASRCHCSHT
jgi:hypothetical protein